MVPDRFLALFDENELELLICGVRDYKLSELVIDYSKNKIVDCESSENVQWMFLFGYRVFSRPVNRPNTGSYRVT